MRNRILPKKMAPFHKASNVQETKTESTSACFNFNALWLQYTCIKVTLITSNLLTILLEIEATGMGQGKQDNYATT